MILIYIVSILSIIFLSIGLIKRYSLSKKMKTKVNIYKYIVLVLGVIFLSLSLMDLKNEEDTIESSKPLVTYFLIDVSKSMLVEDIKPNRLEVAKEIVNNCIKNIRGEFSIVTFASKAYTLVPQTKDRDMSLKFLNAIDEKYIYSGSTDISKALDMVEKNCKGKKIVVILSDGEDKHKKVDKNIVKDMTIFSVALGTKQGGLIPLEGSFVKDRNGKYVTSKVNIHYLASLGSIYSISGNARDVKDLTKDISNISDKGSSIGEIKIYKRYYQIFLIVAIALIFSSYFMPYLFLLFILSCNEGDRLYNKKDYSKAVVEYSKSENTRDKVGKANSLFMLGKYREALKIYEELGMKREAANSNILLSENRDNWEKAESFYREKMSEGSMADRTIWEYISRIEPKKNIEKTEEKSSDKEEGKKSDKDDPKEDNEKQNSKQEESEDKESSKEDNSLNESEDKDANANDKKEKSDKDDSKEDNEKQNSKQEESEDRESSKEDNSLNESEDKDANANDKKEKSDKDDSKEGKEKQNSKQEERQGSEKEQEEDNKEENSSENSIESNSDQESTSEYRKEVLDALEQIDKMVEKSFDDLGKVNRIKGEDKKEEGW